MLLEEINQLLKILIQICRLLNVFVELVLLGNLGLLLNFLLLDFLGLRIFFILVLQLQLLDLGLVGLVLVNKFEGLVVIHQVICEKLNWIVRLQTVSLTQGLGKHTADLVFLQI